jgi:ribosomal protein L37E
VALKICARICALVGLEMTQISVERLDQSLNLLIEKKSLVNCEGRRAGRNLYHRPDAQCANCRANAKPSKPSGNKRKSSPKKTSPLKKKAKIVKSVGNDDNDKDEKSRTKDSKQKDMNDSEMKTKVFLFYLLNF